MKPVTHYVTFHGWRVGTACGIPAGADTPSHTTNALVFALTPLRMTSTAPSPGCEAFLNGLAQVKP